ncbi:MAG: response regulator [Syntrophotaleaceae bacterium]
MDGPEILVAEDNPQIKDLLAMLLKIRDHWKVTSVSDGEKAVAAWTDRDFDIILMDIRMPQMDGLTATKLIRKIEDCEPARHHRVPIIALSANGDQYQECLDVGMDDFISKPFQVNDLVECINKHLKKVGYAEHLG